MNAERQERVHIAWKLATDRIGEAVAGLPVETSCHDVISKYAPALYGKIEDAEKAAESASVEWLNGGPGGVQAKIDAWAELWLEAIEMVRLAT